MNRQKGVFNVTMIVWVLTVTVAVAAFLGLWSYYSVQLTALTMDNQEKAKAIKLMAKEKAEADAEIAGYKVANGNFVVQVAEQNKALADLKKERDTAASLWKAAERKAAIEAQKHRQNVADLLNRQLAPEENWCPVWGGIAVEYVLKRQSQ